MARKRKDLEEKLDTQVINLQAIKEAATTEKKEKKKRSTSLLLFFLGLFMIVMGILYPIIMDTIHGPATDVSDVEQLEDENSTTDDTQQETKNQLTCSLNQVSDGLNSTSSNVFEFNEAGLIKVTTTTKMTATTEEAKQQIIASASAFNTVYGSLVATGIESKIITAQDNSSLTTTLSIDYNVFDLEQYNEQNANSTLSISYTKGMTKDQVQQQMIATGATCQ